MDYLELIISNLLYSVRGHETQRFTTTPPFRQHPAPTITVTSPTCGPSGSSLGRDYTQDGADLFPTLCWSAPTPPPTPTPTTSTTTAAPAVASYLLIAEDVDAPLPSPIAHGLFYNIPPTRTTISNADLEPVAGTRQRPEGENRVQGGFRFGRNRRGSVYGGPRPLRGHGVHRYYFMVVALGEEVGDGGVPGKKELVGEVEGRVLGWGEWVGVCERR